MAAKVIKSTATPDPQYGVTDLSATYGWTQSESNTESGTWAQVTDHEGKIISKILYDSLKTNQINVVLKAGATVPKVGDPVKIGPTGSQVTYIVENVAINAVNNDATRATLTVTKSPGIDLDAPASPPPQDPPI